MLTVHDDVYRDLAGRNVDMTNGHRPHRRPLVGGQAGKAVQGQRLRQPGHVNSVIDEHQLDIRVGEITGHEGVESTAAKHHSHHVWCELLGTDYFKVLQRSTCHLSSCTDPARNRLYEPRRRRSLTGSDANDSPPALVALSQPGHFEDRQRSQHLFRHQPGCDSYLVDRYSAPAWQRFVHPTL